MLWVILLTAVLSIFLGGIVLLRNPKNFTNILFGILSFVAAVWIFNNFMTGILLSPVFWLSGAYAWGGLVIASGLVWVLYLGNSKHIFWKGLVIYLVATFFFISSYINGLIIGKVEKVYLGRFEGVTGPLFVFYSIYFFSLGIAIIFTLLNTFRKSNGLKRSQALFVLIGSTIWVIISISVSFILPLFGYFKLMSLDSPSSLIFIGSIAYAITRYRFLDIRVIIFRSLTFGLLALIITASFTALSVTLGDYLEPILPIRADLVVGLIIGVLVTIFYQPFRKFLEEGTNRYLYKKSYNPDKLLAQITEVTSSILNLDQLLEEISKNLIEAFRCEKFGVALLDKSGKKLEILFQEGFKPGTAEALAGYKNVITILQQELKQTSGILVIDEMKTRYENGEYQPASPELLMALSENNIALIVPLHTKEKLTGVVAIGTKKSGEPYNQQDLRILDIIAGQSAIAIENARLYDELKDFNITLQQKVEAATKELREANKQLQAMDQVKSDFISIASHQLRTPLTIIKGYISMIQEGSFGKTTPEILKQLNKVYIANERLIGLVENLLDISRIESGKQDFKWEKLRLEDLAAVVVENLKKTAKDKELKLIFHKPQKPTLQVLADQKIHEVMMNFIDNAIKYTKEGKIEVFVTAEPKGFVTFTVKDTGIGLAKEAMTYLFKKFSRAKGSFQIHTEGVGLGLFVAKMLIDAHHGLIGAESAGKNTGSKFFFSIPVDGPNSKAKPQEPVTRYLGKD